MEVQSRGSLNPGTAPFPPKPEREGEEALPTPLPPRGRGRSEPLASVELSHFTVSKASTLPNNTYSRPSSSDVLPFLCVFMVAAVSDWVSLCFVCPPFPHPLILPSSNVTCFPVLWNLSKLTTVGDRGRVTVERGGVASGSALGTCGHVRLHTPPLGAPAPENGTGRLAGGSIQRKGKAFQGRPLSSSDSQTKS